MFKFCPAAAIIQFSYTLNEDINHFKATQSTMALLALFRQNMSVCLHSSGRYIFITFWQPSVPVPALFRQNMSVLLHSSGRCSSLSRQPSAAVSALFRQNMSVCLHSSGRQSSLPGNPVPQYRLYLVRICQSSSTLLADIHHFQATQCRSSASFIQTEYASLPPLFWQIFITSRQFSAAVPALFRQNMPVFLHSSGRYSSLPGKAVNETRDR